MFSLVIGFIFFLDFVLLLRKQWHSHRKWMSKSSRANFHDFTSSFCKSYFIIVILTFNRNTKKKSLLKNSENHIKFFFLRLLRFVLFHFINILPTRFCLIFIRYSFDVIWSNLNEFKFTFSIHIDFDFNAQNSFLSILKKKKTHKEINEFLFKLAEKNMYI